MTFKETLKLNKQIMRLIKSKYTDEFPLGYNNIDARYYNTLESDVIKSERFLDQSKKRSPSHDRIV